MRGIGGALLVAGAMGAWWLSTTSAPPETAAPPAVARDDVSRPAGARTATVVRVVDGDTLELRVPEGTRGVPVGDRTPVRLLEIDTPESVEPGAPVECYAKRAAAELERLAPPGSKVWVLPDKDLVDPYGRTLLYVWNADGEFVNLELVRSGAARSVLYEPNDRYIGLMRRAEAQARDRGSGVWGRCDFFGALA
ncbi:thermonuclease family protein [Nocardioides sp. MAHUQ-72]|uniref:thermonuclease family protein n=1 Tax=unclassified Nocardioides TaxID=2615069 RepID=UPI003619C2C4